MQQYPAVTCPFCGCGCGIYLVDCGDRNTRAVGMRTHPTSCGRLCVRGWQVGDLVTSPLQLTHPLVRRDGELVPTSYETAVGTAAELMREACAADGDVWVLGAAHLTNEEAFVTARFATDVVKTPYRGCPARRTDDAAACWLERTLGEPYLHPPLDALLECDVIVLLHSSLDTQHPQADAWVLRAQRAGAKVIVLDEVRWDLARAADLFVRLEPDGLPQALSFLADGMRSGVAPAAADPGGDRDALGEALDLLRQAERAAIVSSVAALPAASVVEPAARLAELLRGGRDIAETMYLLRSEANSLGTDVMGLRPGPEARLDLEELLAGDTSLAATVVVDEDLSRFVGVEGLQKLRPKLGRLIVLSAFPCPTADAADVVLPVATIGQREGTVISGEGRVWLMDLFAEPPGHARGAARVMADLARRMSAPIHGPEMEQVWEGARREVPACRGVSLEALRAGEEIVVDRGALAAARKPKEDPLAVPELVENPEGHEWVLLVRRDDNDWAFDPRMHAIALLDRDMRRAREPYVGLNPEDMHERRLRPGSEVQVTTRHGTARAQVRRVDGVSQGTIVLPYHFADLRRALAGPGEPEGCGSRAWQAVWADLTT